MDKCFVDGSFPELAQEMADYIKVGDQVQPLIQAEKTDEAIAAIVKASSALNSVPEKEFTAAYNLLIFLVLQSKEPKKYLPTICSNLQKPITSSPVHGPTLASLALQTIFNLLKTTDSLRFNVYAQIVRFCKQNGQYDNLKKSLENLDSWLEKWEISEEEQRKLYVDLADLAADANADDDSYRHLLKALKLFDRDDAEEIKSEEAKKLSLRAVRMAITSPNRFEFQDLRALPTVQALADSHPVWSELLDIFAEQDLDDYTEFCAEHEGFIEQNNLDHEKLMRKMRLLTFSSLAASHSQTREIPYAAIIKGLQISPNEVELWAIDVIRAKLVEGKLSQQKKVFLIHRITYRIFGEKQWRECQSRVLQYKAMVDRVLSVVRHQQAELLAQQERDAQELDRKMANAGMGGNSNERRTGGGGGGRKQRTDDDD